MNFRDRYYWADLEPCPVCGRFAGARKMTLSIPEKFFVVCEHCGHKTTPHTTQRHATNEWNRQGGNKK